MTLMLFLSVSFLNLDSNSNTALAQEKGMVPGNALGLKSDADLWRYVRTGKAGSTQMKDELASIMIQSEGDNWRALRNGPVSLYGAFALAGIIGLLVIFFFVRGRITVDSGMSGKTILRFGTIAPIGVVSTYRSVRNPFLLFLYVCVISMYSIFLYII